MRHSWRFLSAWAVEPAVVAVLLLTVSAYLLGVYRVNQPHRGPGWPRRCSGCFVAAMVLIWLAILGPPGAWDDTFFWAHMTQHIILTMLAAPLLVLGSPGLLLLRAVEPATRRRWIVPVLRSRVARWLTDPVLTWVLFAGVLVGTHFSPFYQVALTHRWIHDYVEHPLYLGVAALFYYPLIGTNPVPRPLSPGRRIISLGLMMVPEAMTGFFIYASPFVLYPYYAGVERPFGPGVLTDQQFGGALMWSGSMLLDTAWIALAARDWLRADARKTRRVDRELAERATSEVPVARIRFL